MKNGKVEYKNITFEELQKIAQPPNILETGYWIPARKISIHITRLLLHTGITANQVSLTFLFFSLLAAWFLFMGIRFSNYYFIGTIVFIWMYLVLDCTDGEIARVKGTSHPLTGKVMDAFCHEIFDNAIVIAVTLSIYLKYGNNLVLITGLLLLAGKGIDQRLNSTIIRSVRLYEARHNVTIVKSNEATGANCKSRLNLINTISNYIPYKGILLLMLFAMINEKLLIAYFIIWAIKFNIKFIFDAWRFFKSPETYLK